MFLAVYGEDSLRVREFSQDLLEKFVSKYDPSRLNSEQIDFAVTAKEVLIPLLRAAPFLGEKRFLFLKNVLGTIKKNDWVFWQDVFMHLDSATSLCFVDVCTESTWEKSVLGLWFATLGEQEKKLFPIRSLGRAERVAWICARAKHFAYECPENIAQFLFARVGDDSEELVREIHKVSAYAGVHGITEEEIIRLVPARTTGDFFQFLDLLSDADPEKLLVALKREYTSGAEGFGLFGGILRQLRIFTAIACMQSVSCTRQEITAALALHPFVAQKAFRATPFFRKKMLNGILEHALQWDRGMKLGISAEFLTARLLAAFLLAREKKVS